MLKYTDFKITFAEIPDEISLCINISNCPCLCKNCHSSYLAKDIGIILTAAEVEKLIKSAQLYDCVGETFKTVSTTLGLDFEKVKETFDLKQGANTKKVKATDITKLQKLLEV